MPDRKFDDTRLYSQQDHNFCRYMNSARLDASLKQIVFIRHGQTHMNELIGGQGIKFGQPNFTDVFDDPDDQKKYHDSPLSDAGIEQARILTSKLRDLRESKPHAFDALGLSHFNHSQRNKNNHFNFLDELDLVVVSPLTRALQTLEISLYEHVVGRNDNRPDVPILAVAGAAERLYLVSDLGRPRSELRQRYPFVDFDTAFYINSTDDAKRSGEELNYVFDKAECNEIWHYSPTKDVEDNYTEWRPNGEGQLYACLGEPSEFFDRRMSDFYYWLESREEKCIAIVCHAGVIDWMTSGHHYSNCELRVQTFSNLRPRALQDRTNDSS